ncbi:MAG TPA: ribonuclease III [Alcanivorax sp.]|uniref:ribonuclease III n=1 Tax=Alcanivorax TaxID=59753 RepID=UPI000C4D9DBE|nr:MULTISPECIES: ribonuclease III [Alcanivorax]MAC13796.1 ribonuclease III [Alcanivorax sp.]MBG33738.1 ribonuclease III [Alcanivorax sp.]MDF1636238.1 ribonuclease III [Alcanivorax jadensis]HBC18707.1 ribonuclease III [Alcanivorax sp.]
MNNDLDRLMARLGYRFNDIELLALALTHRSVSRHRNYERLEFLGDAQLGQIISIALFERFPDAAEGQLTRMRASLVRGQTLALVARELGLGDYLVLGGGELKSGGFRRDSILADSLEAIIGAILLDGGEAPCREVVLDWFDERLQIITPQSAQKDAKTRLQEWLQARKFELPTYQVTQVEGLAPAQTFEVTCELEQMQQTFKAQGASRRKAEQQVAATVLSWLEQQYD